MAFDFQNEEIARIFEALTGGGNDLTQPPIQSIPTQPPSPYAGLRPDVSQQVQESLAINPQQAQQGAHMRQPQQQLGVNFPENFEGLGLGNTAPGKLQFSQQPDLMSLYAMLNGGQNADLGGF